jgi:tetratricopeptide (TPR) repeat protein
MPYGRFVTCSLAGFMTLACLHAASAEEAHQVTAKAWEAFAQKDWDGVVQLADRAVTTWGRQASNMNRELKALPKGDAAKKFANLNEVGTCLWLKGEALRQKGDPTAAMITYKTLIAHYEYAQAWDKKGWWWQPADAARKQLTKFEAAGINISAKLAETPPAKTTPTKGGSAEEAYHVTAKAWAAFAKKDWEGVVNHADRAVKVWGPKAKQINSSLKTYPKGDEVKKLANLNEVGTCLWIKAEALRLKGDKARAVTTYKQLVRDYKYAQCWDSQGWWWKPAEAAAIKIDELEGRGTKGIETPPLKASLRLPGKKGICFTLRELGENGSWKENLPRIKAVSAYWNYSWGMQRVDAQPTNMEFLPMAWGAWKTEDLQSSLAKQVVPQIQAGKVKRFLGFNEPDKREQANMPYMEAIKYWPVLESLKVSLCSPACANPEGIDDDSVQGVTGTWMRDFMREADRRKYRIDYIGVHWYGSPDPASFKAKMMRIYEKYGRRPLLITEFAPADWQAKTPAENRHSPEAVLEFMKETLPWIEAQNWIAGYAWFSFETHQPEGTSSALFDKQGKLTACGRYYASVTTKKPSGDENIL